MDKEIKKIVELEIDLEDIPLEEMGVDIVSFVERPAIQVNWMAFNEEFVEPNAGETEDDFIGRCVPIVMAEGYEQSQALAICYSYYEGGFNSEDLEMVEGIIDLLLQVENLENRKRIAINVIRDFAIEGVQYDLENFLTRLEITDLQFDGLEDACWPGWEAIGLKNKNGRQVPNCVPIEAMQFESYTDYPESVKNAAKRGIELNEKVDNKCATRVGKIRAQQLANGEPISDTTIVRMFSYLSRAKTYYNENDTEACGTISYLLWGGEPALKWAESKLEEIQNFEYNPSALTPYVDPGCNDECKHYVLSAEEEEVILEWARTHGEQITENYTYINPEENFSTVGDIATAIKGLDILGKMGIRKDEPAETKYRYTGPPAERNFCKGMLSLNKLYSLKDMDALESKLSVINPGMGPRGRNNYSVFEYKGGVNCRHYFTKIALFKPQNSNQVLMIDQGPAEGNAGKSNNGSNPSPTGFVANNASLRFSFSDDDKRIVAGPIMIPNRFIIRKDKKTGEPYYVYFSKDTIRRIQERFNKNLNNNITDIEHDNNIRTDNVMLEQWIVESRVHDKSRFYGYDLPLGSWFSVYKINDDKTWQMIKEGKLKGFSVAGDFIDKAKPMKSQSDFTMFQITNILNNINE